MRQLFFVCIQALLLILVAHFALKFYFEEDIPILPPVVVKEKKADIVKDVKKQALSIDKPTENFRAFEEFQSSKYIDRSTPVINVMNLNLATQRKTKPNINKINVCNDVLNKIDLHSMKNDLKKYLSTFSLKDFYNTTEDLDKYKVNELKSKAVIGQPSKQDYLETSVGIVSQTPEKDAYKNYEYLMYKSDTENGKTGICGVNGNDSGKLFSVYDDSPILGIGN